MELDSLYMSSKVRQKLARPEDGHDLADSENMFLNRVPNENEKEIARNKKVASFLQKIGMIQEATKLPKVFYQDLDRAIQASTFWLENNDYDESDLESVKGQDAIQTDAANKLNQALTNFFNEQGFPLIAVVESIDPVKNDKAILSQDHTRYPNDVVFGAFQSLTSNGRFLMVLHLATFSEDFDINDVNPSALSRSTGRIIRHELVHAKQFDKRAKKQKVSRNTAKDRFEQEGQIPDTSSRSNYLGSHIEVDAYALEIADELLDRFGEEKALDILRGKEDISSLKMSDQAKEYLLDYKGTKFGNDFKKKVYQQIRNLVDEKVYEAVIKRLDELRNDEK